MTELSTDPRIERSRAAILHAALDHFAAQGYVGARLDDIALEARVSKKTIYNVFGDKEGLFRAVIGQALRTAEDYSARTAAALAGIESVEPQLRAAVLELAQAVLGGPVIRLRRLLIGELERFPGFGAEYYDRAPGLVMRTLAATLDGLAQRGRLRLADPALAAEHLAFLVMGAGIDRALFRAPGDAPPDPARIAADANAGFDAFLAAYARR